MQDLARWTDRVALVTGASSGIGEAVAVALVRAGLRTVLLARRAERLRSLADSVDPGGRRTLVLPADLRREQDILDAFARIRERWGGVDVLVNNAGLGRIAPLRSGSTAAWREMLEVNVLALAVCTREALRDMERSGVAGQVVHISSMSAHRVPDGAGMYSASKFAVRSLTEGLRRELREAGSPVRVTAISPGNVETEFAATSHGDPAAAEDAYGRYPVLQPQDIAELVLYVLAAPPHVEVHDILLRPTRQES